VHQEDTIAPTEEKMGKVATSKLVQQIRKLVKDNSRQAGATIRVMQQVQGLVGYLPPEVLEIISSEMKIALSELFGIVSFYSFFSMLPKGKYIIQVCMGTSCYVRGGQRIIDTLKKELDLEEGGITPDGLFSIETVRCLGCCGLSPVMAVGQDVHRKVRVSRAKEILNSYKSKDTK